MREPKCPLTARPALRGIRVGGVNDRATGTQSLGVGLSKGVHEVRVGYRLGLQRQQRLELDVGGNTAPESARRRNA